MILQVLSHSVLQSWPMLRFHFLVVLGVVELETLVLEIERIDVVADETPVVTAYLLLSPSAVARKMPY